MFIYTNTPKNSFANWNLNNVRITDGVYNDKTTYIGIVNTLLRKTFNNY